MKDRLIEDALRTAGRRPMPSAQATQLAYQRAREEWRTTARRQSWRRRAAGGLLAASVLAVALAIWLWPAMRTPQTVAEAVLTDGISNYRRAGGPPVTIRVRDPLPAGAVIETAAGGRLALRLATGHSLRLDRATRIVALAPREFRLEYGRIYVDSGAAAAGAPLRIDSPLAAISDIGTQFQVHSKAGALRVQVRDGAVTLDGAFTATSIPVASGEFVELAANRRLTRGAAESFGAEWAWAAAAAPTLDAQERRLDRILVWICRELGFQLRYADDRTRALAFEVRVDGSLGGLSPQQALEVLRQVTNFSYRLNGGELTLETLDANR